VRALRATGISRESAALAQLCEIATPTSQKFVNVRLMSGVPEKDVLRRVKHAMQRQGEFDNAEVRTQVSTGRGDRGDDELSNFLTERV
jgi:hypothetical protein